MTWLDTELVNGYKTDNEQRELYQAIEQHLGVVAGDGDFINRCANNKCAHPSDKKILRADNAMRSIEKINDKLAGTSPEIVLLRIRMGGKPDNDRAYTIIYNNAYKTVSSMFKEITMGAQRDFSFDTKTITPWIEGSYPNFFYVVNLDEIETFVEQYNAILLFIPAITTKSLWLVMASVAPMKTSGNTPTGLMNNTDVSNLSRPAY